MQQGGDSLETSARAPGHSCARIGGRGRRWVGTGGVDGELSAVGRRGVELETGGLDHASSIRNTVRESRESERRCAKEVWKPCSAAQGGEEWEKRVGAWRSAETCIM